MEKLASAGLSPAANALLAGVCRANLPSNPPNRLISRIIGSLKFRQNRLFDVPDGLPVPEMLWFCVEK